jgi:hypothetical protein
MTQEYENNSHDGPGLIVQGIYMKIRRTVRTYQTLIHPTVRKKFQETIQA